MKFDLLLSKNEEALPLGAAQILPNSWIWIDRLAQGLISRLVWSKKPSHLSKSEMSDWILLQPYAPLSPLLLAVWNSKKSPDMASLGFDRSKVNKAFYDPEAFEAEDLKVIKKEFSSILPWDRSKDYPSLVSVSEEKWDSH